MEKNKVLEIVKNCEKKSNKDLNDVQEFLTFEFNKTKELIIQLTRHLDSIEYSHDRVTKEINKRKRS